MLSIFGKPLDQLKEQDLQILIDQKVKERQNIEYKREAYGRSDAEIKEMLRDITSIANSSGGYLFIGINENDDNAGIPESIDGIEDAEIEKDRIRSSCLASIEPRIPGLLIEIVSLENGNAILIVYVPRSIRAPHMVLYKGINQFWIRHDRQKTRMTVDEIAQAFSQNINLTKDVNTFIEQRKAVCSSKYSKPFLLVGAAPLTIQDNFVDIQDSELRQILENLPGHALGFDLNFRGHAIRPTLNGLKLQESICRVFELFRNGYCELKAHISVDCHSLIQHQIYGRQGFFQLMNKYALVGYLVSFFRSVKLIKDYLGVESQYITFLSLIGIKDLGLNEGYDSFSTEANLWADKTLDIESLSVDISSPDLTAKILADLIWQAFGHEFSTLFDDDGNYKPK